MKRLLTTLCLFNLLLIFCVDVCAQNETISRLEKRLSTATTDAVRILVLDSLSNYYLYFTTKQDSAYYFINESINIAWRSNDNQNIVLAYSRLGLFQWLTSKYEASMEITMKGIKLSRESNISEYYSALYYNLCGLDFQTSDYKQLLKDGRLAYSYLKFSRDSFFDIKAKITSLLGCAFGLNKMYDSAFFYLNKGLILSKASSDVTAFDANCFFDGYIRYNLKDYAKADSILTIGMEHCKKIHDYEWLENFPPVLSLVYLEQNKLSDAISLAHTGIRYADSIDDKKFVAFSAQTLYRCFKKMKMPDSALYYLELNNQITDEVASTDINKELQQIQFTELLTQREEKARQALENARIRNQIALYVFITAAAAFLIILILQGRNNKQKQKANALLQHQKQKVESTLSELKSTQSQLIQSEKMASLGELTAGIAHEIQNPLNFVNNFSEVNNEMIDEATEEIDKGNLVEVKNILSDIKENSKKINHHGKRADAIVKGMLQHSKQTKGTKEPTDINALCDEYLRLSYHGMRAKDKNFNAEIKTDFDESIGKINIVPQDIGRVLLNLFNNAFYAVNEKKKLMANSYQPLAEVKTRRTNDKIEIIVSDNGDGIPQNIIDKIFQPFFTTKPTGEGTGLGLSLAYDIITKEHNGVIKVESKEGEGSEFIIQLLFA